MISPGAKHIGNLGDLVGFDNAPEIETHLKNSNLENI